MNTVYTYYSSSFFIKIIRHKGVRGWGANVCTPLYVSYSGTPYMAIDQVSMRGIRYYIF